MVVPFAPIIACVALSHVCASAGSGLVWYIGSRPRLCEGFVVPAFRSTLHVSILDANMQQTNAQNERYPIRAAAELSLFKNIVFSAAGGVAGNRLSLSLPEKINQSESRETKTVT